MLGKTHAFSIAAVAVLTGCGSIDPSPPAAGLSSRTTLPNFASQPSYIAVNAEVDFRADSSPRWSSNYANQFQSVWAGLQTPIPIASGLSVAVNPTGVTLAPTPDGSFSDGGSITAIPQLDNTVTQSVSTLPRYTIGSAPTSTFTVTHVFAQDLIALQTVVQKNLVGRAFREPRQHWYALFANPSIIVTNVGVSTKDGSVVFDVGFTGGVTGHVFVYGTPTLSSDGTAIVFPDLRFTPETINYINNTTDDSFDFSQTPANFIITSPDILAALRSAFIVPIVGIVSPATLGVAMSRYRPSPTSSLTVNLTAKAVGQPVVTDKQILVPIVYMGAAALAIQKPVHDYIFQVDQIDVWETSSAHKDSVYPFIEARANGKMVEGQHVDYDLNFGGSDAGGIPHHTNVGRDWNTGIYDGLDCLGDFQVDSGPISLNTSSAGWVLEAANYSNLSDEGKWEKLAVDAGIDYAESYCASASAAATYGTGEIVCKLGADKLEGFLAQFFANCDGTEVINLLADYSRHYLDQYLQPVAGYARDAYEGNGVCGPFKCKRDFDVIESKILHGKCNQVSDYYARIRIARGSY